MLVKTASGYAAISTYVNIRAGLIFKTEVRVQRQLHKLVGKSCKVENVEMNCLLIDGQYYEIVGYYGPLAHVVILPENTKPEIEIVLRQIITDEEYEYLQNEWKAFAGEPKFYLGSVVPGLVCYDLAQRREAKC
jgi:hypothetical protein